MALQEAIARGMVETETLATDINQVAMAIPPEENEKVAKSKVKTRSPHFMSPTIASSRQIVPNLTKEKDEMSPPSGVTSTHTKRSQWLASAAKRVGFIRTSDGIPHSRKGGMPLSNSARIDKSSAPVNAQRLDNSPSTTVLIKMPLSVSATIPLTEKPLPSPPIAQILGATSMPATRSLLDASERPLRRSPPGMPHKEEDWPALIPLKMEQPGDPLEVPKTAPSTPVIVEKDPTADDVSHSMLTEEREVPIAAQSARIIKRKGVPSIKPFERLSSVENMAKMEKTSLGWKETEKNDYMVPDTPNMTSGTASQSDLSASAAAVEKSIYESGSIGKSHTSSLRARLSAGQLIRDSPTAKPRVVGFTDFTVFNEASAESKIHGSHAPGSLLGQSTSPHPMQACRASSPKKPLHSNYEAAQAIKCSQIPIVSRNPSQSSLRSNRRTPGPFIATQTAEHLFPKNLNTKVDLATSTYPKLEARKISEPRRSSIPVFRHTVSSMVSRTENEEIKLGSSKIEDSQINKNLSNEYNMFQSFTQARWPEEANSSVEDSLTMGKIDGSPECAKALQHPTNLEAIEESPKQNFNVKRLPRVTSEIGTTLKTAKSGDRFSMGADSDKENEVKLEPMKNAYHGRVVGKLNTQQFTRSKGSIKASKEGKRPCSSQGLPPSAHTSLAAKEMREKNSRSADLSYPLSSDQLRFQSGRSKSQVSHTTSKASLMDDPFFDARSSNEQEQTTCESSEASGGEQVGQSQSNGSNQADTSSVLRTQSPFSGSKSDFVNTEILIGSHKHLNGPPSAGKTEPTGSNTSCLGAENPREPFVGSQNSKKTVTVQSPATPQKEAGGSDTSSFPPRSSSRTTPPDYTANRSPKKSSISPLVLKDSNEFLARQNRLGACKGIASAQLDNEDGSFKRHSMPQKSYKSQGSLTKGMLSNFRGLFHRLSSDQDSISSQQLNSRSKKASSGANGSPFPPASEIHPIYRPTLCSKNKSVIRAKKSTLDNYMKTQITPSIVSPLPSEISTTTSLALQLFESVRTETSSPKKERSLAMGTILVEAITQAREAEKAVQEARNAARKAEMAHAMCKRTVADIANRVQEWKDEMDHM